MASDRSFVERVIDALQPLNVRSRAMFGEYAFYCDEKVAGFICANTVFLKPTSRELDELRGLDLGPCYPGSKDYFIVPVDRVDSDWFRDAVQATADALPAPKPRSGKAKAH